MTERFNPEGQPESFYDPNDGEWLIQPYRLRYVYDPHKFARHLIRSQGYEGSGQSQKIVAEEYIEKIKHDGAPD